MPIQEALLRKWSWNAPPPPSKKKDPKNHLSHFPNVGGWYLYTEINGQSCLTRLQKKKGKPIYPCLTCHTNYNFCFHEWHDCFFHWIITILSTTMHIIPISDKQTPLSQKATGCVWSNKSVLSVLYSVQAYKNLKAK